MRKNKETTEIVDPSIYDTNIEEMETNDYIKEMMLLYGINISVFRACAALLDGLIPVKRRMLYTFYKKGAFHNRPMKKADDLLGPIVGLHPHGPMSINNSFKNSIKEWETNAKLFDLQGNSGSMTGDSAAATRYLGTRLSLYSMKCFFDDFDEDITEMVDDATRQGKEPLYIPAKYPNFLLSLVTGVAWGNSMNIPPYNLTEVFRLTQELIKNPNLTNVYLYPDSPRGYQIIENPDIIEICEKGRGSLKIQAILEYNEEENYISVRGLPEQKFMDDILATISKLVKEGKLPGVKTFKDRTELEDVEFWVILNKNADPEMVKWDLYNRVGLRTHVDINMNYAGRLNMMPMGIREALLFWIHSRIDTVQRLYNKRLSRKKERNHILDGIIMMLSEDNIHKTIDIVKNSESDKEAAELLMKEYDVTSYQCAIITDLKINQLNSKSREKFQKEKDAIPKEIAELESIVTSRDKIKEIIYDDLEEGIELFGTPRRCQIISSVDVLPPRLFFNVILTKKFIKKMSTYTNVVGQLDSDDEVISVFSSVPDDSKLHIIDNYGKCYTINIKKIDVNEMSARGTNLANSIGISGIPIRSFIENDQYDPEKYSLVIFTKLGFIKKSPLPQYLKSRMNIRGIVLNKGDEVCYMAISSNEENSAEKYKYTLVYTVNGFGISIDINDISTTERMTKGTRYLALEEGDYVKAAFQTNADKVFILTEKGYGKICLLDDIFKSSKRRVSMIRLSGLHDGDNIFIIIPLKEDDLDKKVTCFMQSGEKLVLNLSDVQQTTRVSKGKRLIHVKRGDSIIKIKM